MKAFKLFLTDCDGCLTDGGMYYTESGDEFKKFHAHDGMGFKLLRERGILTGIITGEDVEIVERRARKLKVDFLRKNVQNKVEVIQKILDENDLMWEDVVYVGDDVNDYEVMQKVGIACSVKNAQPDIKACAKYVSEREGGNGAVREIIEWLMRTE